MAVVFLLIVAAGFALLAYAAACWLREPVSPEWKPYVESLRDPEDARPSGLTFPEEWV